MTSKKLDTEEYFETSEDAYWYVQLSDGTVLGSGRIPRVVMDAILKDSSTCKYTESNSLNMDFGGLVNIHFCTGE